MPVMQFMVAGQCVVIEHYLKDGKRTGMFAAYLDDRLVAFGDSAMQAAGRVVQRYSY